MSHRVSLLAAGVLTLAAAPIHAATIGFESAEGYTLGALHGKPTTGVKWSDNGGLASIVDMGGDRVAQFGPTSPTIGAFSQARYVPTAATFGTTAGAADDPTSTSYAGRVEYSFDLAMLDAGGSSATIIATIKLGNDDLEMYVLSDGRMQIRPLSGGNFNVKTAGGVDFDFDTFGIGSFVTISGALDYATDTFTVAVNGIAQSHPTTGTNIQFKSTTNDQFNLVMFQNNVASNHADYRRLAFDDFVFNALVPEPTTLSLAGLGGLLVMSRNRRG